MLQFDLLLFEMFCLVETGIGKAIDFSCYYMFNRFNSMIYVYCKTHLVNVNKSHSGGVHFDISICSVQRTYDWQPHDQFDVRVRLHSIFLFVQRISCK